MNRLLLGAYLAAFVTPALAQAPAAPALVREPLSNFQTGADPDRYIGDPFHNAVRIKRDIMRSRVILGPGDPSAQGADGAVLRYRKEASLDMLSPGESTLLTRQSEQQIVYVESGEGRLDTGARFWDLKPGYIALIPANAENRIAATGAADLVMVSLTGAGAPGAASAAAVIIVRDTAKVLYVEQGVHWNNVSKAPFADLGERILMVGLGPMSIAGAHAHTPETEEGWVKLTDGKALIQIGSELRPWAQNVGLVSPNNSQTVHAAINTGDAEQVWLYFQGRPAPPPPPTRPATAPTAEQIAASGGRVNSPEIFDSAIAATVESKPLRR